MFYFKKIFMQAFVMCMFFGVASQALAYTQQDLIEAGWAVSDATNEYNNHISTYNSQISWEYTKLNQNFQQQQFLCERMASSTIECMLGAWEEYDVALAALQQVETEWLTTSELLNANMIEATNRYNEIHNALYGS